MTALRSPGAPNLSRALLELRTISDCEVAFGGFVDPRGSAFCISETSGTATGALAGLTVRTNEGLGGKALALARPTSVRNYETARGITHVHDGPVLREQLRTVAAIPVTIAARPRLILYIASRRELPLEDRWVDTIMPIIRHLEREYVIEAEVAKRLEKAAAAAARPLPADLAEIAGELNALKDAVQDETLQQRIVNIERRLGFLNRTDAPSIAVQLSPREIDVLREVAKGCSNIEAADNLGLLPNTVKAYLKTAMRKLGVNNRVQAIISARSHGILP